MHQRYGYGTSPLGGGYARDGGGGGDALGVGTEDGGSLYQNSRWIDYNSFIDAAEPISALSFHDSSELMWIGSQTGRLTSYLHTYESNFSKYSSFRAYADRVLEILPIPKHVISISSDMVRMHTVGGLPVAQFNPDLTNYHGETGELTCGTLFEPSGGLFRAEAQKYLFLGSSTNLAYTYDLNFQENPLVVFDLGVPTASVQSSVTFLSVGGIDGKIRLLDPSLRSNSVQHIIDAHNGGISSFSLQSDGMALISCGFQSRSINPYDIHSPVVVTLTLRISSPYSLDIYRSTILIPL
jgi:WD40 repeat protein